MKSETRLAPLPVKTNVTPELSCGNRCDTGDLNESFEKIYERYGTNLQAFFHDAYDSVKPKQDSDD